MCTISSIAIMCCAYVAYQEEEEEELEENQEKPNIFDGL